jgi:CHAD domain-containing protein
MRKLLKNIQYAEKSANMQMTDKLLPGSNALTDLLGKWHDAQVIRLHLNKLRNNKRISSRLKTQLEHVKARLALENKQLMDKISKRLAVIKNA